MADNQPKPEPGNDIQARDGNDLIAVGVGASAGGLEAFTDLVKHLPSSTGMAFILVQHLDPHHTSALPELLADKTRIPVLQIQGDTPIQPDRIYVIPPNTLMRVRNRTLVLEARPEAPERFRPIDVLFDSLAQEFRFNAVGIVLSGTASDGTQGLKTIKAEGGITFAQNQTAKFDSMPRSAISAGAVDFVLPPRRMAEELTAISHRTVRLSSIESDLAGEDGALQRVLLLLRNRTGVNFAQYKQPTILRRLQRRMILRQTEDLEQYLEFLQREPEEIRALFDEMLINVTGFFRDPEVFEAAKQVAFPAMPRGGKRPLAIRVWIPGCSSGEEVYSMAIALVEFLSSQDLEYTLQIFGTDISEPTIDKARAGVYDDASVANLSPERLRRFFVRTESGYQINRSIRDMCIFSRHNVANDPPLSRMDLISCRNLLIYLAPSLQRRVIARFGYALQPNGCLILGASETLGGLAQHFHTLDEPHRIYSRNASVPAGAFDIWESRPEQASVYAPVPSGDVSSSTAIHSYVDTMVLSLFAPAALVVDPNLRIIEFRGDTAPYVVAGRNERDAVFTEVVQPQFRPSLASAIEQARQTDAAVIVEGGGSESSLRAVTVIPFALSGGPRHFLILFGQQRDNGNATAAPATSHPDNSAPRTNEEDVAHLKQELKTSREYLQTVIEELRSTNEEAQSANEELQSTNEEMQTSKEELQSANEELHTINAEMQSRNSDLARANDDLINLLSSMNMPIVMTGSDLRIRRFTPVAERMLRLIPADIGRPIADLKPRINVPNLEEILRQVVETLEPHEQEVQDEDGRLYLMRVRAYRTADHRIDGTVLQLVDVTELKRSMEEVRHARDYAEAVVNTVREPLVVLDRDLAIVNVNRAFYSVFGVNRNATLGQKIFDVAGGFFDVPEGRRLIEQLHRGPAEVSDIEIEKTGDHGQTQVLSLSGRRLQAPNQQQLILIAVDDITERKLAAEARYRRLFESARDGIVLVDAASGEILDLNPYTERLLGHSRNELVGRPLWEIEPLRNATGVRAAVQQIADMGAARFDDFPLRTREGQDIQAEVMANLYTDGDRRAIQFNIRDVSERKKFERELRETQKLESLGLLAGGIAHDFNNLLTGIMGNASLAYTEAPVDQPLRIRLRDIVHAAERAAFLTRQMLAYSGRGRFVVEPMDVGELIREISALLLTSIPKTVELKLDLAPDLPQVEADTAQIQQVMMNLVINGAEAIGDRESGRVEVCTSLREIDAREAADFFGPDQAAPGLYIAIEVRDTGAGMDEATKARIFDPFFTTKFTGRGLGLAAVQGIVKGHRGCIRVYSTPGHGTSFLILLPAVQRKKQPARAEREPRAAIPPGSVVLVIDDEETIRSLTTSVLSRKGMKVLTAVNGAQGVEMFREHKGLISLVILDLLMPVMGGEEAFALMQGIDPQVPIILSSGFDVSEAARRFEKHKPARFLQKPYTADRLLDSVASTLKRP